jgi:hypothetical protein
MKGYKDHNKDNKPEERFSRFRTNHEWFWQTDSIVLLGGKWDTNSSSGSTCSSWTLSANENLISGVRNLGVCKHLK